MDCGKKVIDEIIAMIEREEQPDGSAQKENSEKYKKMKLRTKGYTTPLWGVSGGARSIAYHKTHEQHAGLYNQVMADYTKPKKSTGGASTGIISPYLGRKGGTAWTRAFFPPDTLEIFPNTERYMIMVYLQSKGYWFMGITNKAEQNIQKLVHTYFQNKIAMLKWGARKEALQRSGSV